ncbi:hypothetical protein TRFO_19192 [Tritrichomonas foetus]|uniref:Uncharacterized protein n=1 Tax=Tritrichomonas foetus TaxID=1144522 RepID=A0A1J4KJ66_9EUKA|nr:hypothetical protein TRFO_19192 [Tritrichomonas foetus]|eukprot:OHT11385.1 hypothetical protein TRFO_19192 [Tritrichomonas foetus]
MEKMFSLNSQEPKEGPTRDIFNWETNNSNFPTKSDNNFFADNSISQKNESTSQNIEFTFEESSEMPPADFNFDFDKGFSDFAQFDKTDSQNENIMNNSYENDNFSHSNQNQNNQSWDNFEASFPPVNQEGSNDKMNASFGNSPFANENTQNIGKNDFSFDFTNQSTSNQINESNQNNTDSFSFNFESPNQTTMSETSFSFDGNHSNSNQNIAQNPIQNENSFSPDFLTQNHFNQNEIKNNTNVFNFNESSKSDNIRNNSQPNQQSANFPHSYSSDLPGVNNLMLKSGCFPSPARTQVSSSADAFFSTSPISFGFADLKNDINPNADFEELPHDENIFTVKLNGNKTSNNQDEINEFDFNHLQKLANNFKMGNDNLSINNDLEDNQMKTEINTDLNQSLNLNENNLNSSGAISKEINSNEQIKIDNLDIDNKNDMFVFENNNIVDEKMNNVQIDNDFNPQFNNFYSQTQNESSNEIKTETYNVEFHEKCESKEKAETPPGYKDFTSQFNNFDQPNQNEKSDSNSPCESDFMKETGFYESNSNDIGKETGVKEDFNFDFNEQNSNPSIEMNLVTSNSSQSNDNLADGLTVIQTEPKMEAKNEIINPNIQNPNDLFDFNSQEIDGTVKFENDILNDNRKHSQDNLSPKDEFALDFSMNSQNDKPNEINENTLASQSNDILVNSDNSNTLQIDEIGKEKLELNNINDTNLPVAENANDIPSEVSFEDSNKFDSNHNEIKIPSFEFNSNETPNNDKEELPSSNEAEAHKSNNSTDLPSFDFNFETDSFSNNSSQADDFNQSNKMCSNTEISSFEFSFENKFNGDAEKMNNNENLIQNNEIFENEIFNKEKEVKPIEVPPNSHENDLLNYNFESNMEQSQNLANEQKTNQPTENNIRHEIPSFEFNFDENNEQFQEIKENVINEAENNQKVQTNSHNEIPEFEFNFDNQSTDFNISSENNEISEINNSENSLKSETNQQNEIPSFDFNFENSNFEPKFAQNNEIYSEDNNSKLTSIEFTFDENQNSKEEQSTQEYHDQLVEEGQQTGFPSFEVNFDQPNENNSNDFFSINEDNFALNFPVNDFTADSTNENIIEKQSQEENGNELDNRKDHPNSSDGILNTFQDSPEKSHVESNFLKNQEYDTKDSIEEKNHPTFSQDSFLNPTPSKSQNPSKKKFFEKFEEKFTSPIPKPTTPRKSFINEYKDLFPDLKPKERKITVQHKSEGFFKDIHERVAQVEAKSKNILNSNQKINSNESFPTNFETFSPSFSTPSHFQEGNHEYSINSDFSPKFEPFSPSFNEIDHTNNSHTDDPQKTSSNQSQPFTPVFSKIPSNEIHYPKNPNVKLNIDISYDGLLKLINSKIFENFSDPEEFFAEKVDDSLNSARNVIFQ